MAPSPQRMSGSTSNHPLIITHASVTLLPCPLFKKWWNPPLDGPAMDFGCGTGLLTMSLLDKLGTNVVGVDPSLGMLAEFDRKAAGKGVTTFPIEV